MNRKKRLETTEEIVKKIAKTGIAGIILLLLASVAYAAIPISDGFDYPVGWPNHIGYSISGWSFLENEGPAYDNVTHPGEDWNRGSGDDDLGDPVNATANGHVIASGDFGCGWGNIIMIEHKENESASSATVWSNYAHLETMLVSTGDYVRRGEQIGTIGKGTTSDLPCDKIYPAHLHFEIRKNYLLPNNWLPMVKDYDQVVANYCNPSGFINQHRPQTSPLIGDWNGNGIDTTGTFDPRTSIFSLKDESDQEIANQQFGEPGDIPIVGDWNRDREDTIGVYRPKEAKFFLDNNNDGVIDPVNDQEFLFGNIGDYPIVGDWDKDGKDEVGVYRILDTDEDKATFFLKKSDIVSEVSFDIKPNDMPIVGDWNNDDQDDVGVFRRNDPDHSNNAVFYLKYGDTVVDPIAFGNNDDIPIAGKPQIDKLTRVGIYRPTTGEFIFKLEPIFQPSGSLDLIFLIDTTGSMGDDIASVKASAGEIVNALDSTEFDYRVAVADYRDYPKLPYGGEMDYVHNLKLPFSSDKSAIINSINGLNLGWGADWRESVYSALVMSMTDINKDVFNSDNYGWRSGVHKAIIIMGDAPPHDPELWEGGYTLEDVIYWSENIDPIRVYSIVAGSDGSTYAAFSKISEKTGGKVYSSPDAADVADAIIKAIRDIGTDGYGVDVDITPIQGEVSHGNSVEYSVNITNKGDLADVYNVSFEAENILGSYRGYPLAIQYSWIMFDDSKIALDPGMSEIRSLAINIPQNWAGMEDVIYTFNITAISATDTSIGNTSSADLKVKVGRRSMAEYSKLEIQWLAEMVRNSGIDAGIKNALLAKLTNAESKVDKAIVNIGNSKQFGNNLNTAQNMINAFINQVNAQYDKKIMQPDAEIIKKKANQIWQDLETAKNS